MNKAMGQGGRDQKGNRAQSSRICCTRENSSQAQDVDVDVTENQRKRMHAGMIALRGTGEGKTTRLLVLPCYVTSILLKLTLLVYLLRQ